MIHGDKQTDFLRALADRIEQWYHSPVFTPTPQTVRSFSTTLRVHTMLIDNLLNETYQYVIITRLQIFPQVNHLSFSLVV